MKLRQLKKLQELATRPCPKYKKATEYRDSHEADYRWYKAHEGPL